MYRTREAQNPPKPHSHWPTWKIFWQEEPREERDTCRCDVLSPELIVPNEYECSFIKSLMNIVVGKLSQSQMHSSVEFVRHQDRVSDLFSDPSLDIKTCFGVADGCLQITYQKKGESLSPSRRSQMCINASVTSLARIKLDQSLRLLQANQCSLIYTDTDSVVFCCPKNVDPATILELHPSKSATVPSPRPSAA